MEVSRDASADEKETDTIRLCGVIAGTSTYHYCRYFHIFVEKLLSIERHELNKSIFAITNLTIYTVHRSDNGLYQVSSIMTSDHCCYSTNTNLSMEIQKTEK